MFGNADRRHGSAAEFRAMMDSSVALRSVVATALLAAAMLASAPAQAQFACTFTGALNDETCVNSGTAGNSPLANPNAGGKLTATNTGTGTVNGAFETVSGLGGDANLTNAGGVAGGLRSVTQGGGNASANNSGTVAGTTLDPFIAISMHFSSGGKSAATRPRPIPAVSSAEASSSPQVTFSL
jgi:hypothetical protein